MVVLVTLAVVIILRVGDVLRTEFGTFITPNSVLGIAMELLVVGKLWWGEVEGRRTEVTTENLLHSGACDIKIV